MGRLSFALGRGARGRGARGRGARGRGAEISSPAHLCPPWRGGDEGRLRRAAAIPQGDVGGGGRAGDRAGGRASYSRRPIRVDLSSDRSDRAAERARAGQGPGRRGTYTVTTGSHCHATLFTGRRPCPRRGAACRCQRQALLPRACRVSQHETRDSRPSDATLMKGSGPGTRPARGVITVASRQAGEAFAVPSSSPS